MGKINIGNPTNWTMTAVVVVARGNQDHNHGTSLSSSSTFSPPPFPLSAGCSDSNVSYKILFIACQRVYVSPLSLKVSALGGISTATFQPPYNWLTIALRRIITRSLAACAYSSRTLDGSDSACLRFKVNLTRRWEVGSKCQHLWNQIRKE